MSRLGYFNDEISIIEVNKCKILKIQRTLYYVQRPYTFQCKNTDLLNMKIVVRNKSFAFHVIFAYIVICVLIIVRHFNADDFFAVTQYYYNVRVHYTSAHVLSTLSRVFGPISQR